MRFAVNVPNFGEFADARLLADLAREAELAGWDGFFLWDHLLAPGNRRLVDPWIALTAIALATSRIKFGPMVTPLPRRRPEEVARQSATLDHLSNGRFILGVGSGDDWLGEYQSFNGPSSDRTRGKMLDEALKVIDGLWSGEAFSFEGDFYQVRDAVFLPRPLQSPRIPVWVAGHWPAPRPFRRAAGWDGAVPTGRGEPLTPEAVREILTFIAAHRDREAPIDLIVSNWHPSLPPDQEAALIESFAGAGATWYQVSGFDGPEQLMLRIRRGPSP